MAAPRLPGGGIFLAVGWPGQWTSSFVRDAEQAVSIKAGQELAQVYLKPGEQIRAPLLALLF